MANSKKTTTKSSGGTSAAAKKSGSAGKGRTNSKGGNTAGRSSSKGTKSTGTSTKNARSSKNTASKSSAAADSRRAEERRQERQEARLAPARVREIYLYVTFALNLFLVLGTFGVCGKLGSVISGFFFGLFGSTFYVLPLFAFVSVCFILANGPKYRIIKKILWVLAIFMAVGFIMQLIQGAKDVSVSDLYMDGYSNHSGGGLIFGGILAVIYSLIGKAGSIIVIILLLCVAVVEVTGASLLSLFKEIFTVSFEDIEDEYEEEDDLDEYIETKPAKKRVHHSSEIKNYVIKETDSDSDKKKNKVVEAEEVHEIAPEYEVEKSEIPNSFKISYADESEVKERDAKESEDSTGDTSAFRQYQSNNSYYNDSTAMDDFSNYSAVYEGARKSAESRKKKKPVTADLKPEAAVYADEATASVTREDMPDAAVSGVESDAATKSDATVKAESADEGKVTKQDTKAATEQIANDISEQEQSTAKYVFPPMKLLKSGGRSSVMRDDGNIKETAQKLKQTLESFGVKVTITNCSVGPTVTRYEMQPEAGVKVSKILSLTDDIKLSLAAADIRIEAPIPGKSAIGIEVPNKKNSPVYFRDLIDNDMFERFKSKLAFAVGKDIGGQIIIFDIAKMPHLLIAGATGSGKSVCINTIIMSVLYKATPHDVRMIMIDPKMVELSEYNGIPHLLIPVVTDPKKAAGALNWAVNEMTKRYQLFQRYSVRNLEGFNNKVEAEKDNEDYKDDPSFTHMPQILIIVDELADLMMVAHNEVEDSIVRLSQLARAAGIHLVIATQRPSVDVITGLIKANVPSRIALSVSSGVDSRTIIDMVGAEKLLGNGDMLFYPTGYTKPVRVQGGYISDEEIAAVTGFIKKKSGDVEYDSEISTSIDSSASNVSGSASAMEDDSDNRYDEYFEDAGRLVIEKDKASIGNLQRVFRIGFNRAARIMDQLCEAGVVGPEEGTKPRKILMTMDQFEEMMSL